MRRVRPLLAGALGFGLTLAGAQGLDSPKEVEAFLDREPEDCLSLTRINRTVVADDETVLFYMRGGDVYQNILPRRCPGLKANDRFMYSPFSNRLCDTDTITVLEQFAGRLDRGVTCRLGEFYPITEIEAEELLRANDEDVRGGGPRVQVEPVDLPDEPESDESGDGEAEPESE
jgi:hypothetical protein